MTHIVRITLLHRKNLASKPAELVTNSVDFEEATDAVELFRQFLQQMPNPVHLNKLKV